MANSGNNRFQSYLPGISNVGSYQVSGKPYITGSADIDNNVQHKISFPQVAKSVTVINKTAVDLRVHFADKAEAKVFSGLHYVTLTENRDSITFNVKCKEIYITAQGNNGAYELVAELTGIETGEMSDSYMGGAGINTLVVGGKEV
jgi:hypothetical protein